MIQIQEMNLVSNDRDFFKESSGLKILILFFPYQSRIIT
ncbi:hypothetical protein LEP1GSC125_3739 [Leptospira mayottensis 200901122]|uniref:Uncharacterized protein n=1 Tax=Leptospira mayottensis 200901122 TaxID=1193010 RepID=A0AA87MNZ0_9LEPT|nr:hypothetical protein LEP1GSC125_3739 [Leptospira mayottensis 200901122]